MFSSGGYFRGFNCPFFASGLCERPYCHYRHVKTEEEKVQSKAASSGYSDAQIEEDLTIGNGPASLKGEAVKVNKYTGEPEIQTAEKTDVGVLPQEHVNKYTGEPMVAQPSNEYVVEVKSHCKKYKPTDKKYNGEFMGAEPVNEYTVEVNSNCRKYNPTNKKYNGGPMVTKPSNEYTVEVKSDCKKYNPTDKHYDGEQITQPSNEYTVELNSNCKKYRPTDKQSLKSQRPKLQIHKPVQKLNKYTGEPVVDIVDKQTYTPEAKDFPEYNPTPINQLKPSLSKYQAGTLDNENEQEYDPQSNFSTTSLLKPSQPMAIKRTFTYDPTTPDFNHPAKRAKGDLEEAGPEDDKDESDDGEMGMFSEDEEEEEIRIPTLADSSEEEDSSKPSIITDVKVFENLLLPVMDHDNNSNETSGDTKKKLPKSVKKSHTEKDHAKKIRTREKSSNHEKISSKSSVSNENKKNGHSHKERTSSKFDSSKSSKHSSSSKSRENSSSRASSSKSSVKDSTKSVEKQSSSHSSDKSSSKHTHHKSSTSSSSKPKSSSEKETPKKYSSSSKQKNEHSKHSAHDKSSNKQDHRKHSTDKKNEQTGKSHKKHESSEHHKHESSGHSKHESSGPSKHESRSKSSKETSKDSVKGESKKRDRSVSLDSNGSKRKIVDINLDLFGMDSDEEDSIPPLISDEEEEDPYEECLRIYNESNVSKPSPKKKSRTERSISETEQSESVSIPGKKRTAHKGSREVTRKIPEKPHSKLSPAQIMHNRFVMMQKQAQEEAGRSQEASTSSSSGKQRVAHQSNVNQKVKNGREGTKVVDGKTVVATASKTQKRTAHVPNVKNIKRPTIPAEYGSKVPISVRQRYLNSIIDECLHLYDNEEDAYKRGLEEELTVYKRASNKTVYLNVACNTIKRLRTEVAELTASPTKPTSPLKMSHEAVLGGKNATRTTYTLNRSGGSTKGPIENFKGSELYNRLARYIMTEEQLQENGFPRPDSENSSVAKIYTVSQQEQNSAKLKTHEKICVRCGKRFMVFPNGTYAHQEECSYHWGKAWKKKIAGYIETRYTCCQGDLGTEGCQIAKCHVHETNKWENRTGYMKTLPCSPVPDGDYGVYAMDCEMVYTQGGVELARVTVTDCENSSVYETLVRPDRKIIDYNTRFSGITNEDMVGVTTTIRDVQAVLLSLFTEKTILIGHSLESDLAAVKIIHDTVVDTSVVFPHRLGPPYKRALKTLMAEYMKKIIQDDVGGHDSQEDAISCMELMQWRVKEDARKEPRCS